MTALAGDLNGALLAIIVFTSGERERKIRNAHACTKLLNLHRFADVLVLMLGARLKVQINKAETLEVAAVHRDLGVLGVTVDLLLLLFTLDAHVFSAEEETIRECLSP